MPCSIALCGGVFGGELRRERRRLARALEALTPADDQATMLPRDVGDGDDRVVERRRDVGDAALDVLLRPSSPCLPFAALGRRHSDASAMAYAPVLALR